MESSIAEFLLRLYACELQPTNKSAGGEVLGFFSYHFFGTVTAQFCALSSCALPGVFKCKLKEFKEHLQRRTLSSRRTAALTNCN